MTREFMKTFFYIDANYKWGEGFNAEQTQAFNNEIKRIFTDVLDGWTCTEEAHNGTCATYTYKDGISSLYCHPQDLVGIIDISLTDKIIEALQASKLITFRFHKHFEYYSEQTKEEIKAELETKKQLIIDNILEGYHTIRRNMYKSQVPLTRTCEQFEILSIHDKECLATDEYIHDVFKELVSDGRILEAVINGYKCWRSLNKSEMKNWKKSNKTLDKVC